MTDRVTEDLAMIARNAIDYIIQLERQRNTLMQALKRIEALETDGDFLKLASDCQEIAYAALAKAEAHQP